MDPSERKAALKILRVFKTKDVGEGGFLHFDDFGNALVIEGGYPKHDMQRNALMYLRNKGYINEGDAGLELTEKGAKALEKL